ncbi:GH92 family glycosyl hydrolase [Carboxylicivirga sp. N1Y90]|uniref:GH92 family glycosyl hydrolase n=1 Tax=Carboxylicivirga fragile TaxID=3417571 RepID=UPI003D34D413|nr:GH92 family glycosyl hydrolase [Marinilabiliaceae bacterium N1Y90]
MNRIISLAVVLLVICQIDLAQEYTKYVNPFIGTTNFGTTNPGAIVPQGMVSVVPFNVAGSSTNKWDKDAQWWSTPYSWDNQFLTGFSHVNLSGVGCPDLGVIMVMPTTGEIKPRYKDFGSMMSQQEAELGYYSCMLDKYQIKAEVTATPRTGLSQFTFPEGQSNILIDLGNGLTNEQGASIRIVSENEVEGFRMTGDFCYHGQSERPVYFVARFSKSAKEYGVFKKMPEMQAEASWSASANEFKLYQSFQHPVAGDSIGAYFSFDTEEDERVQVQLGVSYVSIDNARQNLEFESTDFNFQATRENAQKDWESTLSKVKVEGGTKDQLTIFYTALYHMNIHPNIINDVNGQYPLMENYGTGLVEGRDRYTVFSLWDTYRNLHPLMSLLYPEKQLDMVRSMVDMYKEGGWLPKWELNSSETYTMNGDPSFPVIVDTYRRGLRDFDVEAAYEAMLKSATTKEVDNKIRTVNDFYLANAYVPFMADYDNSVSIALELYLADWNLAQFAKDLGHEGDYNRFMKQSKGYVNYFDKKEFKMLRPKNPDGTFLASFDPLQGENFEPVHGFHEGTAWQYAFGVPHDIKGIIKLYGGSKKFTNKLQRVFDDGLFDMANEPDMHYPFLFNNIKGEEWRSQKETRRLIDTYFLNTPGGIPGNDDCGTMSAWLVYAMMGIYPVCPGDMDFAITTPVFDKVSIELNQRYYKGESFEIIKEGKGNIINQIKVDGQTSKSYFINNKTIISGSKLVISTKEK